LTVFDIVSFQQIWLSYLYSLSSYFELIRKEKGNGALYSINSYDFFLTYHALKNLPENTEIIFCNQKDRWALLFGAFTNLHRTLVQHGTSFSKGRPPYFLNDIAEYFVDDDLFVYKMPYKINSIDTLYAFNHLEAKYINRSEITNFCDDIHYIGYYLTKLQDKRKDCKSILIVGYYNQFKTEEHFLLQYFSKTNYHIYLKTHPTIGIKPYRKLLKKYNFELIQGNIFPNVDYVFSYQSTLGLEYEAKKIKVIYYNDIRDNDGCLNKDMIERAITGII
jgi:hypothetical protein